MTAYLGELGGLIKVVCPSAQSKETARPARYVSTLGGSMFAQVGPRTKRSWDVRLPATSTPAEIASWQAFVEGEHGLGPWWFIPEMAATTNLISPRGAVLDSPQAGTSLNGGPLVLPDGRRSGRSLLVESTDTNVFLPRVDGASEYVPVMHGTPVSASVWVRGPRPRLRVQFYDAAFEVLTVVTGATGGAGTRILEANNMPVPMGAVAALLRVDGVTNVARPSITWTDTARPWSSGEGAPKVHVAGMSTDVTLAVPGREMAGASFQVQEVG